MVTELNFNGLLRRYQNKKFVMGSRLEWRWGLKSRDNPLNYFFGKKRVIEFEKVAAVLKLKKG